ncbi:MAG: 23S rRNA (uracil(1939)-C(5))-methyltransferase RlmD [Thermodesulfobacteriota bacterium]|nr:23S rRNA (uracil(1939)-C(5))-methyltransferase RlmD [Thermodesulfobacteriota bacterium]
MTVKKGQILELKIEKLIFGGRGLAWVDGFAIFVEKAVPGDEVRARVFRKKKNHAEARVLALLQPSPFRIAPPCPYSGFCGGCPWQFLDYEKQLAFKTEQVVESLEHIGQLRDVPVHPAIPSEREFGYRNKMEFSFSDRRWLLPEELSQPEISKGFALGLHVPGSFHKVLDIDACLLQPPLGNKILGEVRRYTRQSGIPPYGLKSHRGFWRFLMLRYSPSYDNWMVNIVTSEEQTPWVAPLSRWLCEKFENVISVVNNVNTRRAAIAVGERERVLAGQPVVRDRIGGFEFEISANSFFQTNTAGAECLYGVAKDYARLTGKESVLDLYSGTGTIAIFLADGASKIVGVEISETAVEDAKKNCQKNQIDNCQFMCLDIRKGLHLFKEKTDVMIVDPPRAGMHPDVVNAVCQQRPARIVYVSCNPATLARDLATLKAFYRVAEVQPVDMFPHTHHIECVARLESMGDP